MEQLTITRALRELKLLDSRITKTIEEFTPCDIYQNKGKNLLGFSNMEKTPFKEKARADYQSIVDLIERRSKIKALINVSNSVTSVTICGKRYTVVEAIELKSSIEYKQKLRLKLNTTLLKCNTRIQQADEKLNSQLNELFSQALGKDKKVNKEDYDNISKPFIEANEVRLFDAIGTQAETEKLAKFIDEFLSEVDIALSESNALTTIEL